MRDTLTTQISKLALAMRTRCEIELQKIGQHSGQSQILLTLDVKKELSQADLSKELGISPASTNIMVKKLEKTGAIETKPSKRDRRILYVRLTKLGSKAIPEIRRVYEKVEIELTHDLTETERIILPILLSKVFEAFQGESKRL